MHNIPANPAECSPETAYKRQYMPKSVENIYVAGEPRSVSVHNRILAVAVRRTDCYDGEALLFDTACSGETCLPTRITVGPGPDMLTFTPDGRRLLVANTGEVDESHLDRSGRKRLDHRCGAGCKAGEISGDR